MAEAQVCAVVVNYNAGPLLAELAASLAGQPGLSELIVVDNASSDGSLEPLEAGQIRGIPLRVVKNLDNRGFAAACNQGAALAGGRHLLFINPDCRMAAGALARLMALLDSHPDAGMAGPLILNADGSEQRGCRRYLPDPRRALMRVLGLGKPDAAGRVTAFDLAGTPLPMGPTEVEAISGACMLVRSEAFEDLDGWDEGYFLHCEDLDLCMRIGRAGFKVMFVPDAVVNHTQGVSSRKRPVFVLWHKHRGMWRYFSKFQRATSPLWLVALVWFGIWGRFLTLTPVVWLASFGGDHARGT